MDGNTSLFRLIKGTVRLAVNVLRDPRNLGSQLRFFKYEYFYPFKYGRVMPFEETADGFSRRKYDSHKQYLNQQRAKLPIVSAGLSRRFDERTAMFYDTRFSRLFGSEAGKSILCLGARDGVEVRALRQHGLLAVGIDIAYPDANPYVHYGDFHSIPYPDNCFDYAYTNVLDHMLDPRQVMAETRRILKSGRGGFVIDFPLGSQEIDASPSKSAVGTFEAFSWRRADDVLKLIEDCGFKLVESRRLSGDYTQAVFRPVS